ncbi:hypothetical protein [Bacillus thuringiensis]|uniref:hypothetical protein n=1 Tax=Bacillus thuringiensis TaxID=1428 RepID=UPI000BFD6AE0|nr:hypothetical protein [Bacillus thuringiensis]PGT89840.1 hypothetical protein COD17_08815 [Bacillus thuringiensis]
MIDTREEKISELWERIEQIGKTENLHSSTMDTLEKIFNELKILIKLEEKEKEYWRGIAKQELNK